MTFKTTRDLLFHMEQNPNFWQLVQPSNQNQTMHISALKQSKFLTRNDVGRGMLVTIDKVFQANVAKEGAPEEMRYCVSFLECEKPMVLNSTNGQIIAGVTGSEETDTWTGHKIVLYDDPNVSFGGKLVGGIRCRAPRTPQAQAPQVKPKPQPVDPVPEDDVPF